MTFADHFETFHGLPVFSEAMAGRIAEAFGSAGTEVDLSGHQTPRRWRDQEWRYVAVSE